MRHFIRLLALFGLTFTLSACSSGISEGGKGAADAYTAFTQLLRDCSANPDSCDKEAIWNNMDAQSKSSFLEAYTALVRINRMIETYFDPIEHKYMKAKTGTDILEKANIKEFKDLYLHIFKPEALVFNDNVDSCLQIQNDSVESSNKVIITTNGNCQSITMIRESDGVWRTAMLLDAINQAVEPIMFSEDSMREYAKSNLETEFKRRLEVQNYFIEQQALRLKQGSDSPSPTDKPAEEAPQAAENSDENAEG